MTEPLVMVCPDRSCIRISSRGGAVGRLNGSAAASAPNVLRRSVVFMMVIVIKIPESLGFMGSIDALLFPTS